MSRLSKGWEADAIMEKIEAAAVLQQ